MMVPERSPKEIKNIPSHLPQARQQLRPLSTRAELCTPSPQLFPVQFLSFPGTHLHLGAEHHASISEKPGNTAGTWGSFSTSAAEMICFGV